MDATISGQYALAPRAIPVTSRRVVGFDDEKYQITQMPTDHPADPEKNLCPLLCP